MVERAPDEECPWRFFRPAARLESRTSGELDVESFKDSPLKYSWKASAGSRSKVPSPGFREVPPVERARLKKVKCTVYPVLPRGSNRAVGRMGSMWSPQSGV